ncbi:hypothetical protein [Limosilactobacillus caviae]|jgi:hypothetical protein|uniref:AbrB family transcriptional regulator n=1 Tax=Limosilactobacillus caviae TaxID=1769424 RepID=A0ABQ2C826_9LACO|nr:hypothetical protein [Limosilactobacillus caviae]MCD7125118.1 hypothetical protein [Limosilactobacillus caviae]MRH47211.1 hypothetical protein [Limosilactobacillus reuteri]GGI64245.1 hypothetical protein GCM10011459_20790 [Limosilactobacillus caviae]
MIVPPKEIIDLLEVKNGELTIKDTANKTQLVKFVEFKQELAKRNMMHSD